MGTKGESRMQTKPVSDWAHHGAPSTTLRTPTTGCETALHCRFLPASQSVSGGINLSTLVFLPTYQIYLPRVGEARRRPACLIFPQFQDFRIKRQEFVQKSSHTHFCLHPSKSTKMSRLYFTSSTVQWFLLGDVPELCRGIISCHNYWEVHLASLSKTENTRCLTLYNICLSF